MNYLSAFLMTKDENRYLREWVAFHRTQGFEKFYIYDNLSSVPVSQTLEKEITAGLVEVKMWEDNKMGKHHRAMDDCLRREDIKTVWLSVTDTDEFIYGEEEKLIDLLKTKEKDNVSLKFKWKGFGFSGHEDRPEGLVIESFLQRGNYEDWPCMGGPHPVGKSIARFGLAKGMADCHNVRGCKSELIESGFFINHYVTRSREEFKEKSQRGGGNGVKRGMHLFNIYNKNLNKYTDTKILKWLEETKANMQSQGQVR
jgi:hypothetical protein